jgi:hypothetical protein
MSELLNKFKQLCTTTLILPDNGEIKLTKVNVDFQSKLHDALGDIDYSDTSIVLRYLQYVNEYIINIDLNRQFTYKDKLCIINFWRQDIIDEQNPFNVKDLNVIDKLKDISLELQLNKIKASIKFTQCNLMHENNIIDFLLNKEKELNETDILFFDSFRFLHSIAVDDKDYETANLSIGELYDLYLLFDIDNIKQITQTISSTFESISNIRNHEGDFSAFY